MSEFYSILLLRIEKLQTMATKNEVNFADLIDLPDRISSDLGFKSNICLYYCLKK